MIVCVLSQYVDTPAFILLSPFKRFLPLKAEGHEMIWLSGKMPLSNEVLWQLISIALNHCHPHFCFFFLFKFEISVDILLCQMEWTNPLINTKT